MSATARDQAVDQVNETSQTIANIVPRHFGQRLADFFALCKPRVNTLIVFTAMIGMFLASPGFPPLRLFLFASLGIALVAGAAAAINCLVERTVDALMSRTRWRGTARGTSSPAETLVLALLVGGIGVMNVMVMNVAERRREIGVRMALGARPRDIARLFLLEAVVLAATGALAGAAVGLIMAWAFVHYSGWSDFSFSAAALPLGIGSAIATGLFFGLSPAMAAARLTPVQALRDA